MKKILFVAALLSAAAASQASAASLINLGGNSRSLINVSPQISLLNGNKTNILTGLLSGNSVLNGSSILSGNGGSGLLGLGILSGNNNNNNNSDRGYSRKRRGCR